MSVHERSLAELAAEQHGVFSVRQAARLGIDASTIRKRASRGLYIRLHNGVYAIAGSPVSWQRDAAGLVLSVPKLAAASHKTAAYLWEMSSVKPTHAEIVTVRHQRVVRGRPQIHESVDLRHGDVMVVDGTPTTTPVRTVVDLGATASSRYVEHCLDEGIRLGLFDIPDVNRFIARVARSGRNGIGTIRPLVEERVGWTALKPSHLENLFRRIVSRSTLPMPVEQYNVYDGYRFVKRPDFAYPDHRISIELDSERWHMDPATFRRDREKQNELHALGWTVYRFTWHQLQDDPGGVIAILAAALSLNISA